MLNMNKTKMDFLIGVAKALLPQHTPTPRHTPALQFFFSYYCIASHSDWIMALLRTGQELLLPSLQRLECKSPPMPHSILKVLKRYLH